MCTLSLSSDPVQLGCRFDSVTLVISKIARDVIVEDY